MKREVTYHCGHSETRSFSGSHSARDAYIEKLSREDCPACRAAARGLRSAGPDRVRRSGPPDFWILSGFRLTAGRTSAIISTCRY